MRRMRRWRSACRRRTHRPLGLATSARAPGPDRTGRPPRTDRTFARTLPRVLPGPRDISRGKEPGNVRGNVRSAEPQVAGCTFSLAMYSRVRFLLCSAFPGALRAILHRRPGKRARNVRGDVRRRGASDRGNMPGGAILRETARRLPVSRRTTPLGAPTHRRETPPAARAPEARPLRHRSRAPTFAGVPRPSNWRTSVRASDPSPP